jgi:acyl carrier protein
MARLLADTDRAMPPLRGIIHAAGALDDGLLLQMSHGRFRGVMSSKVEGAWNLHALTATRSLDFFVLFSSVTGLLGSPGQANYAAGNAFLDALAHLRRAQGRPALSINWGPWSTVGLAAAQANRGDRLASRGVDSLSARDGVAALAWLLAERTGQIAVTPFDGARWREFYPTAAMSNFLSRLGAAESEPARHSLREQLLMLETTRERRSALETYLQDQIGRILHLAPSRVDLNRPLQALGFDSLMTLELRNRLEAGLGLTLSATIVWNYPTVAELVPHLAGKLALPLAEPASAEASALAGLTTPAGTEPGLDEPDGLDDLSQDELATLLEDELAAVETLLKGS